MVLPSGASIGADSFSTITCSPPMCCTAKKAAAITAVILMKNWIISMTRTPHSPECAAKATFSTPQSSSVCQRGRPNRILAILQAAKLTEARMKQLKNRPRYTERNPRTTPAAVPE